MKFKVGDKVKFIGEITDHHIGSKDIGEDIRKYNNLFTIAYAAPDYVEFKENRGWYIKENEIELVQEKQFTRENLKDGDKCTLKNGKVIFFGCKYNYNFNNLDEQLRHVCNDNASIVKVERPVKYETVFDRKEEVLDAAEKRYLAGVIRPFRDKVKYIYKEQEWSNDREFINIILKEDTLDLPYFKKGTMYKGMELGRNYTLEELGL